MTIIGVIPARYSSRRFPGKSLTIIEGKPLIQHVYERAAQSPLFRRLIVATDDGRIYKAVRAFGGDVALTSLHHGSGTDRVAEVARKTEADLVVNIQGDEPLLDPQAIDQAVRPLLDDPLLPMATLAHTITSLDDLSNPNVVKVVLDLQGYALYFSRSPIPSPDRFRPLLRAASRPAKSRSSSGIRSRNPKTGVAATPRPTEIALPWYRHVGLYAFRRRFLLHFTSLPPTPLEKIERLEQLRALENGYKIKVILTEYDSIGVDVPEDLLRVRERIRIGNGS